ncbi:MAG: deoxyribose-phosphate aldolase [candidate division Zixibacteria bacterium]|nr:deoxyribose-phosphate aldolase [candidate division Zixibacteria bacterium]
MKVAIGADHGGYELKEKLKNYLSHKGVNVEDCGTHSVDSVDYPRFAYAVASKVSSGECSRGIIIDGAGIGSCMVANKVKGVRAALCYDVSSARNSREHNDANVVTLGAGLIGFELAKQIIDMFLSTECTVDRHKKRVAMIDDLDTGKSPSSPTVSSSTPVDISNLDSEDLAKIAGRIQSIIGGTCTAVDDNIVCSDGKNVFIHYGHATDIDPDEIKKMIDAGAGRIGYTPNGKDVPSDVAKYIDHTLLKPQATPEDITKLCNEAKEYGFAAVCVNSCYVKLCSQLLMGTDVEVCSVVGFPLGATPSEIKAMEARRAIRDGAKEIDMVINVGKLKGGDDDYVLRDIRMVTEACHDGSAICKVIIEAAMLTDEEKVGACQLSKKARADFVKTSTGFGPGGATAHDVALMSEVVKGTKMGVKAAGGIKSYADAQKMIQAGATRIGASAGIKISKEAKEVTISN